jgi:hypothetical protein
MRMSGEQGTEESDASNLNETGMCGAFTTMTRLFTIIARCTPSYLASKLHQVTLGSNFAPEPSSSAHSGTGEGSENADRPAPPSPPVAPVLHTQAAASPENLPRPDGTSAEIPPTTLPLEVVLSSAGSGSSVAVTTGPTAPVAVAESQVTPDDGLSLEERRERLTRVPDFLVAPPRPRIPESN